ncbi:MULTISPECIES: phage tail protein [unclassified Nocardia]|uniref:phage tail protein n=1 Tax=unclassified Nocardia TaxID=2637762 RepID=UPI00278BB582|nr:MULTISPECIES: phage tail protein [unclassified Nocardia]
MNPLLEIDTTKIVYWGCGTRRPWHLAGIGAGREGVALGEGMSGHMFPPVSLLTSAGARQDGATFLRSVRHQRELDFIVHIGGDTLPMQFDSPRDFFAVHDAWWRDWSTDIPGVLGVFTRYQGWRFYRVQLDGDPEPLTGIDPAANLHEAYRVSAVAMDPLAQHFDEVSAWVNGLGLNEGVLRLRNAADQPAWPRYTMNGPGRWWIQDPVDTDGLRVVQTPLIGDGETLRIDTHPRRRTARVYSDTAPGGRNVWGQLAGRRWLASLPPWSSTDIVVRCSDGATTAAAITAAVTPRSSRPF